MRNDAVIDLQGKQRHSDGQQVGHERPRRDLYQLAAKAREEHSRSVLNAALERRRAREVLVNAIHQVQLRQQLEASHAAWEAATQQKPEGFDEFATREP